MSVPLERWKLPRDLLEKQNQLTELALPPKVDRLNWLSEHITTLDAAETQISSLSGLPRSLKQLDIRDASQLNNLDGLPPNLEVLKVSGRNIALETLPSSLVDLYLHDTDIKDLSNLPSGLEALVLSGTDFNSLDGLPVKLKSLTLHGTRVKSLRGLLPDALQKLVLIANEDLRFEDGDLPPRLTYLIIDDQAAPNWNTVRYLCALSDRRLVPQGPWPSFLSSLTLRATNLSGEIPALPSSLRALGLLNGRLESNYSLPPELESLDLTGYRGTEVKSLPPGLRTLKLADSSIQILPALAANLEELDISNTNITKLDGLPQGLKRLIFQGSSVRSIDILNGLPSSLEKLDLTGSLVEEIGNLPLTLCRLNLRGTKIRHLSISNLTNMVELDISGTPIGWESLRQLPTGLRVLTLSEGQMDRLDGLPASVKVLRILRLGS
jgi:hypothetical protein